MIQEVKKAVMTSISDVLGTMLFMVIEFEEEETLETFTLPKNEEMVGCFLDFEGVFSGTFVVLVPESQLQSMAIDFMGMNAESLTDTHSTGTLKEVANMIAGNSFGHYDDKLEFSLGIPEMIDTSDISGKLNETGKDTLFIKVRTEESFFIVKVVIR